MQIAQLVLTASAPITRVGVITISLLHEEFEITPKNTKMDIDGVALVAGAGKAHSSSVWPPHTTSVKMASLAFIPSLTENNIFIYYVTGSGIGREVALTLASRGANTVVCADINLEAAQQTAEMSQSRKAGHLSDYKVHALYVDVRDEKSVQQMVNEAKSLFGRIDYFVNTAGVSSNIAANSYDLESVLHS